MYNQHAYHFHMFLFELNSEHLGKNLGGAEKIMLLLVFYDKTRNNKANRKKYDGVMFTG